MIGGKPGQGVFRKVFVTGGNGFIGRALMRLYRERGAEVCGMDLLADQGWNVVAGDLIEPASWQSAANGCDLMIHTAALVSNTSSMLDSWRANVLGTRHALDVAVAAGVRRFVHMSSVAVFGFEHESDVDEKVPLRPIGHPYVDSKIASEHTVLMAHTSGEIECTIVRPGNVYGPASRPWVVLPLEILKAGRSLLPARGQGIFSPVYIDDLLDGIARAAESPAGAGQVFNLTGTEKLTCAEYFGYLARMLGKRRFPSIPTGLANVVTDVLGGATRMLGRPSELGRNTMCGLALRAGFSIEKARRLIGYEPRVTLAGGMARVERWCREQRLI